MTCVTCATIDGNSVGKSRELEFCPGREARHALAGLSVAGLLVADCHPRPISFRRRLDESPAVRNGGTPLRPSERFGSCWFTLRPVGWLPWRGAHELSWRPRRSVPLLRRLHRRRALFLMNRSYPRPPQASSPGAFKSAAHLGPSSVTMLLRESNRGHEIISQAPRRVRKLHHRNTTAIGRA